MDTNDQLVNIKTTPEARRCLRLLAAMRGETMQMAAERIFKAELDSAVALNAAVKSATERPSEEGQP